MTNDVPRTRALTDEEQDVLRLLSEHAFDFSGVRVQRDGEGRVTGYTLTCTCGFEFPPSRDENYHLAHLAVVLAAAGTRA